jgi:hypothetical protein
MEDARRARGRRLRGAPGHTTGVYTEALDLGPVQPDPDGIRRANLRLDAFTTYHLTLVAYNLAGESPPSEEAAVPAIACAVTPLTSMAAELTRREIAFGLTALEAIAAASQQLAEILASGELGFDPEADFEAALADCIDRALTPP